MNEQEKQKMGVESIEITDKAVCGFISAKLGEKREYNDFLRDFVIRELSREEISPARLRAVAELVKSVSQF